MSTKFPRYKLVNETGIGNDTKLIDLETGQQVANVAYAKLFIAPDNIICADVRLTGVTVDVGAVDLAKLTDLSEPT